MCFGIDSPISGALLEGLSTVFPKHIPSFWVLIVVVDSTCSKIYALCSRIRKNTDCCLGEEAEEGTAISRQDFQHHHTCQNRKTLYCLGTEKRMDG